jgi:nucleoid-associated protein YgaU
VTVTAPGGVGWAATRAANAQVEENVRVGEGENAMGLFDFIKSAGKAIGIGGDDKAPEPEDLKAEVAKLGFDTEGLDVSVDGDKVSVKGKAVDQETKEKLVLALGNVAGVSQVEEDIETEEAEDEAVFYTVKSGDTLSKIAKEQYGNANKYMAIFEANKPMLSHPDKIYPGQVLRIPAEE